MKNRIFVTNSVVLDQALSEAKAILARVSKIGSISLEEMKAIHTTLCKTRVRMEKVKAALEVGVSFCRED